MAASGREDAPPPQPPSPDEAVYNYNLHVSSRYLDLTKKKLELARLPHGLELEDQKEWNYGIPKGVLEPSIDYWLEEYNWRERETHFNARLPQFRTTIAPSPPHAPLRLHFVHKRSSSSSAIPLLYCHSWPGGIFEVSRIIDALTEAAEASTIKFHVVVPSIPGCGFSDAATADIMSMKAVAEVFDRLMLRLGYQQYVAHGTDWGFSLCRMLAIHHHARCLAIHTTTPLPYLRPPSLRYRPWQYLKYLTARATRTKLAPLRCGYHANDFKAVSRRRVPSSLRIHSAGLGLGLRLCARPYTLAYALCDSPVGLLAWTREALHARTGVDDAFTAEDIIDFTMISWLPGPEAALRYLAASSTDSTEIKEIEERWSNTALGLSIFPSSETRYPPPWAACVQPVLWTARHEGAEVGWPVWERPREFVDDLRRFFGDVVLRRYPKLKHTVIAPLECIS